VILTRTLPLPISILERPRTRSVASNGLVGGSGDFGIAAIARFEIAVEGEPDPSGYLVDIRVLDSALGDAAGPRIREAMRQEAISGAPTETDRLVRAIATATAPAIPARIASLAFFPNPHRSVTATFVGDLRSEPDAMPTTTITETFEFAASHRLHLADRSDDENRRMFGKCNNPNGHGHNYRIEIAVEVGQPSGRFGFVELEDVAHREVMQRFDHKHLNLDCPEFRALNPSVENIAMVCHGLLEAPIRNAGGSLQYVRVWETEKTSCRYPA
jgi:6-pyruvoyltetrahydropterin/6-carboxytetrahydropterin synthase